MTMQTVLVKVFIKNFQTISTSRTTPAAVAIKGGSARVVNWTGLLQLWLLPYA